MPQKATEMPGKWTDFANNRPKSTKMDQISIENRSKSQKIDQNLKIFGKNRSKIQKIPESALKSHNIRYFSTDI